MIECDLEVVMTSTIRSQWEEAYPDVDLASVLDASEQVTDESRLPRVLRDGAIAFQNKDYPRYYFLAKEDRRANSLVFIGVLRVSTRPAGAGQSPTDTPPVPFVGEEPKEPDAAYCWAKKGLVQIDGWLGYAGGHPDRPKAKQLRTKLMERMLTLKAELLKQTPVVVPVLDESLTAPYMRDGRLDYQAAIVGLLESVARLERTA